ncbi:hypothetical protein [Mucilaginibacter endophyticus]|uniref:hypothetical protein n=1 Tax=Mucilaginibacter endophyticus TaxID=2675003 RepID=UPI000E0D4468|nr:hypothetical protein [Mucilaginibacter endophyticus]
MFDNPVLDVAIGLIFIFLLYSLLATTIKELVATIFSYRPRMLELALERMLDGKHYSYYWWNKLFNILLWISNWINLVFNFTRKEKMPKPGHISGFMKNIPQEGYQFRRWKLNEKADLFAARFVNHPIYKRAAEDSMFNKKPAYLSASSFSDILLDIFHPAGDKPLLLADIRTRIDSFPDKGAQALHKDTKAILLLYIQQANGDLQRFRALLEAWYNETMDRVSGWYKRQAYKVLFVIGMVVAISFNVDTIAIVRTLSNDKPTRDAMVKGASAYVQQQMQKVQPKAGTAVQSVDTCKLHQDLDKITRIYKDAIAQPNVTLGIGWDNEIKTQQKAWKAKYNNGDYQSLCFYWFFFWNAVWPSLLGFFITALAISLGSPFWFDLLNKFINLRVSGKRPEDEAPVGKAAAMNQKPVVNSFG